MEATHLGSGNRIGTVVFVDIVGYSEESVSRQAEIRAWFSTILATALEHTPVADRLVVDTGDGAALCFLGNPEDALFAANSLRRRVLEAPGVGPRLRLGINLGPVRVVNDINGHSNVIGDGINMAQRVMSFAKPNQILVSRSYFEVVSRLAPEYSQLFQYAGLHRDKHVREHEVYEVQLAPPVLRAAAGDADSAPASAAVTEPALRPPGADARVARFDPVFIERLTTALAREIGPLARLVVRRDAEGAADERMLCETLAAHVPAAKRAAFLAGLGDRPVAARAPAGAASATGSPKPGDPGSQGARPARRGRGIGPDLLARAEQMLTRQIGPVARILVRQAAKHAESPHELFESLAVHIDNAEKRKAFIAEAERLE